MAVEWEKERRNRIRLSVAAYAYEFENDILMEDHEFDQLALQINPEINTGDLVLDSFFREEFHPDTGQWVQKHPDLAGLKLLYRRLKRN